MTWLERVLTFEELLLQPDANDLRTAQGIPRGARQTYRGDPERWARYRDLPQRYAHSEQTVRRGDCTR